MLFPSYPVCFTPLVPKNSKMYNKMLDFFLWVIIWYTLLTINLQKLSLQQIAILREFNNMLVCHLNVVHMSTTFPIKRHWNFSIPRLILEADQQFLLLSFFRLHFWLINSISSNFILLLKMTLSDSQSLDQESGCMVAWTSGIPFLMFKAGDTF